MNAVPSGSNDSNDGGVSEPIANRNPLRKNRNPNPAYAFPEDESEEEDGEPKRASKKLNKGAGNGGADRKRKRSAMICPICKKSFPYRTAAGRKEYKLHREHHTDADLELFVCQDCGKVYKSALPLLTHYNAYHEDLNAYYCHKCKSPYLNKTILSKHECNVK